MQPYKKDRKPTSNIDNVDSCLGANLWSDSSTKTKKIKLDEDFYSSFTSPLRRNHDTNICI